jgi:hypothetical protein
MSLGFKGRDLITGFSGIITGKVHYITGCNQLLLTPSIGADGKPGEAQWIDEQRVELEGSDPAVALTGPVGYGPDREPPKR